MNGLLISCGVLLIATWIIQGFNLWSIAATITTFMFMGRKIGYFCKYKHLVVTEAIAMVVTVGFQIVLSRFHWQKFLFILGIRGVFLLLALYDIKMFVYYTEKRRRH